MIRTYVGLIVLVALVLTAVFPGRSRGAISDELLPVFMDYEAKRLDRIGELKGQINRLNEYVTTIANAEVTPGSSRVGPGPKYTYPSQQAKRDMLAKGKKSLKEAKRKLAAVVAGDEMLFANFRATSIRTPGQLPTFEPYKLHVGEIGYPDSECLPISEIVDKTSVKVVLAANLVLLRGIDTVPLKNERIIRFPGLLKVVSVDKETQSEIAATATVEPADETKLQAQWREYRAFKRSVPKFKPRLEESE